MQGRKNEEVLWTILFSEENKMCFTVQSGLLCVKRRERVENNLILQKETLESHKKLLRVGSRCQEQGTSWVEDEWRRKCSFVNPLIAFGVLFIFFRAIHINGLLETVFPSMMILSCMK